jgi:hypothetical protein
LTSCAHATIAVVVSTIDAATTRRIDPAAVIGIPPATLTSKLCYDCPAEKKA